jgi:hypothetical protein
MADGHLDGADLLAVAQLLRSDQGVGGTGVAIPKQRGDGDIGDVGLVDRAPDLLREKVDDRP